MKISSRTRSTTLDGHEADETLVGRLVRGVVHVRMAAAGVEVHAHSLTIPQPEAAVW